MDSVCEHAQNLNGLLSLIFGLLDGTKTDPTNLLGDIQLWLAEFAV
jgi:hypothetical protein